MRELRVIDEFVAAARHAVDKDGLARLVEGVALEMGFDWFSVVQLDMGREHGSRGLITITNYPDDWIAELRETMRYGADPAFLASRRAQLGFKWSDMSSIIPIGQIQREILRRSRRVGLADGFTVPAHVPGEPSGLATFAVGPARKLPEKRLAMAQLFGSFAYDAARRLRGLIHERKVALTPRQIDCILQVARGKSDWEISMILGIGKDTVSEHLDAARVRYGVTKRSQLVVRALHDGLFSLQDAIS